MTDRLSNLDAAFFASALPDHQPLCYRTIVFEGPAPGFEAFLEHVRSRIGLVPRLTHRVTPVPLGLGAPEWTRDPAFELDRHVLLATVSPPGGEEEVRALSTDLYEGSVDVSRPPWLLWYLDGLEGERFGAALKLQHAMADGLSMIHLVSALFPPKDDDATVLGGPGTAAGRSRARIAARAAVDGWRRPIRAGARHARGRRVRTLVRRDLVDAAAAARLLRAKGEAPVTPLNRGPCGPSRRIDWVCVSLEDVRRTKAALGTTLNKVVLAATAGALRRHLVRHDALTLDLVAMVPVSVRREREARSLGNRVNSMYVHLPVTEASPQERVRRVTESVTHATSALDAPGVRTIGAVAEYAPPAVMHHLRERRLLGGFFNLAVTNSGRLDRPIHCCGRPARLMVPTAPLTPHHGLGIVVLSYLDTLVFGITADPERVPDSASIAADVRASLDELHQLASTAGAYSPQRKPVAEGAGASGLSGSPRGSSGML